MPSLRRLGSHWKLKLTSLALAVLLWVVVSAEQQTTQWIPVRVEPVLRDPDFVLSGPPQPATVRVRFTGPGRELWELALRRPTLVLPIRSGTARSYVVDPQMVELPPSLHVRAEDVRPAMVRLDLQRMAVKDVPVRADLDARLQADFIVGEGVRVTPATVRVAGPADVLAQIDSVATLPIALSGGDTARFARRVALDTAGLDGLTVSPMTVRVSGTVERRPQRAPIAVAVDLPPGLAATPAEVRVTTPAAVAPASLHATIARDSLPAVLPPAGADVPIVVEGLPAGATARVLPPRVHVVQARAGVPSAFDSLRAPASPLAPAHAPATLARPSASVPARPTPPPARPR